MSGPAFGGAAFANLAGAFNVDVTQQWDGVALTKSASINTRSAWQNIGTVGVGGCDAILLRLSHLNNSGSEHGSQWDIGIGPSGSQVVLLNSINQCQPSGTPQTNLDNFIHVMPCVLPPGTVLWARAAVDVASSTCILACTICPISDSLGEWGAYSGIDIIGSIATGGGTQLTGAANAKGSWVSLGITARNYAGIMVSVDYAGNTALFQEQLDIGAGTGGSQVIVVPDLVFQPNGGVTGVDMGFIGVQIAAGTNLWGRTADIGGGTAKIGLTLYGFWQ